MALMTPCSSPRSVTVMGCQVLTTVGWLPGERDFAEVIRGTSFDFELLKGDYPVKPNLIVRALKSRASSCRQQKREFRKL